MASKNNFLFAALLLTFCSCYSFKGISVPPGVETFYVENFNLQAFNAPSNIEVDFTEALRQKLREEARLKFDDENPHVSFSGSISDFNVGISSATGDDVVALNRLSIVINVKYEDTIEPDNSYEKTFREFEDFDAESDLTAVQSELIELIFDDVLEKLFNDTYTNW